jgi:hypothetical protein
MPACRKNIALMLPLVFALLQSCIAPNEIEVLVADDWTVFGIAGQDRAPVVFIYKVSLEAGFSYNYSADVVAYNEVADVAIPLVPVMADGELNIGTNEFPFGNDWSGRIVYYTTPGGSVLPGGDYTVYIRDGDKEASCRLVTPSSVGFSDVEVRRSVNDNGEAVSRLFMTIDDTEGNDLYKWEISVDQVIPVQVAVEFDPDSGEPTQFETEEVLFRREITPDNYITEANLQENDRTFTYNLSAGFPRFDHTEVTYLIHVRLRHYSHELMEFFGSSMEQREGPIFDPFAEPVFIRSNISGLPGVIAAYAYSNDYLLEYQP